MAAPVLPFSTLWPGFLAKVIPSYLYWQFSDDEDLQAFVEAYNNYAQEYLDWFNNTPLAAYTNTNVAGDLLDWIGEGIYGVMRPTMPLQSDQLIGPYDTAPLNTIPFDGIAFIQPQTLGPVSDDIYRRVLTWQFYKGDGTHFNMRWLKRRIMRFLTGVNGIDPGVSETYDISCVFNGPYEVDIDVYNLPGFDSFDPVVLADLQYGIKAGILPLPFQFTYNVTVSGPIDERDPVLTEDGELLLTEDGEEIYIEDS